jgi:hypothetical protein
MHPEGNTSSAWTPELRKVWVESWALRGARWKSTKHATKKLRRARRSDRQPLFHGRSDCSRMWSDRQQWWGPVVVEAQSDRLDRWSHCQPLSGTRSDHLVPRLDRQCRGGAGTLGGGRGTGRDAGMGAALQELSCRKMSKSLVRWDETAKGKSVSSKTTCRKMMMLLVERPRHRQPL